MAVINELASATNMYCVVIMDSGHKDCYTANVACLTAVGVVIK